MKRWQMALIAVIVIATAVGGFFGGRAAASQTPTVEEAMKALQNASPEQVRQAFARGGLRGGPDGGASGNGSGPVWIQGGNAVAGSIVGADADSITVKTADGSTKIVLISGSTSIAKTTNGTMADLTTGQNVIVTGTTNSDGTMTATRVQVGEDLPSVKSTPGP